MPLVRSFAALVRDTLRLWLRHFPQVGTWLLLGWLLYTVSLFGSAVLGAEHRLWAVLVMVVGVIAKSVSVIFAIHSLEPGLRSPALIRADPERVEWLPEGIGRREPKIDVAILAIGPLLAVYSVWGIIDDMVRDGLTWNGVVHTFAPEDWAFSLSSRLLPTFLGVGAVALVLRLVFTRVVRKSTSAWARSPLILLEGLWVFSTFFIVLLGLRQFQNWLVARRVWRDSETNWHRFLEWLPDVRLAFDLTLPEALARAGTWFLEDFFPAVWEGIALPLVWLAIVAIVFGWREFNARDLLGSRLAERSAGLDRAPSSLTRVASWLTADLRDKYLPLLHAFRLIWRSGPYVLGSYLVLCALVSVGGHALSTGLLATFAVGDQRDLFRSFNAIDAVRTLLVTGLSICLYAATFDRALSDAARLGREEPPADPENAEELAADAAQDSATVQ